MGVLLGLPVLLLKYSLPFVFGEREEKKVRIFIDERVNFFRVKRIKVFVGISGMR